MSRRLALPSTIDGAGHESERERERVLVEDSLPESVGVRAAVEKPQYTHSKEQLIVDY
jgi:hypothetical protein